MTFFKTSFTLILLTITQNLWAIEQITSYHSDITIQQNGQLHIIETIQVEVENKQINHGIHRDFPTTYTDSIGNITRVGFNLITVKLDGLKVNFHTQKQANGIRIYAGNKDTILKPGLYSYHIEYTTDHQLGYFDEYDELYFNVTGNGWNFPILQASAKVTLPSLVDSTKINLTGYTGLKGSTQHFMTHHIQQSSQFYFETTQALDPLEGLTIVANWPKGIITEPGEEQTREFFIQDNKHSLIAIAGLAAVFLYYVVVWLKVGKDPEKGIIRPLYQVPEGFSPASIRFISQKKYDKSCFTSALINLITNGFISLEKNENNKFVIRKLSHHSSKLAAGEALILTALFDSSDQITITQAEHKRLGKALKSHETSLRENYEKLYFLTNKKFFMPGIVLSLASIIIAIKNIPDEEIMVSTISTGIFSLIPFLIVAFMFRRTLKKRKPMSVVKIATNLAFIGIFFFIGSDIISNQLPHLSSISWPVVISLYLLIATNILFQQWLKAPTLAGRKLLDKIESLKLYLDTKEDQIKQSGQSEFNGEIYLKFLPYAIALGVDHTWSQKLERAIEAGLVEQGFTPTGFHYLNNQENFTDFSNSLSNNFDSAISSSSTAPGSTSGSSGGGSSGGGGGGGGGGGW